MQFGCHPHLYGWHLLCYPYTKVGVEGGVEPPHKFHTFRILTSVYEAITYNYQENCRLKNMEYLPLWFLYSIVTIQGLLVGSYNFSNLNLLT